MDWKLNQSEETEYTPDNSGVYTIINKVTEVEYTKGVRTVSKSVRCDIMRESDNEPLQSFVGSANAVRKDAIRWISNYACPRVLPNDKEVNHISTEHASYIGYELARAETIEDYVQG